MTFSSYWHIDINKFIIQYTREQPFMQKQTIYIIERAGHVPIFRAFPHGSIFRGRKIKMGKSAYFLPVDIPEGCDFSRVIMFFPSFFIFRAICWYDAALYVRHFNKETNKQTSRAPINRTLIVPFYVKLVTILRFRTNIYIGR